MSEDQPTTWQPGDAVEVFEVDGGYIVADPGFLDQELAERLAAGARPTVVHGYEADGSSWVQKGGERTSTPTLAEFLLARIADDEAVAREGMHLGCVEDDSDPPDVIHGPLCIGRLRAECKAKRRIVEDHSDQHDCTSLNAGDWPYVGCRTLRLLALPYADHPAYREEWRP